jgi:peptidoglycan/xylan/chitin deacetylase (PgdA/CDA1 family)
MARSSEISSIDVIKRRRKRRKKIMVRIGVSLLAVLLLASLTALAFLGLSWQSLKEKNDTYKANYAQQNQEMGELKTKVAEANNLLADLQEQIDELQAQKDALEKDVADLKAENADLEAKLEQTSTSTGDGGGTSSNTGEPTRKVAYLTFDDGISDATNDILDILKEYNVKATFFVNWKDWRSGYKETYKRIIAEGHTLANHTNTHEFDSVYDDMKGFEKEVMDLHNNVKELTGYEMTVFRFPGGSNASYVGHLGKEPHKLIHDLGYEYYDWNVDSGDASGHNVDKNKIVKNVLNGSKNYKTAIILMHDLGYKYKRTTVEALPEIIEGLRDMGFSLEALSSDVKPTQFRTDPRT